MASIIGSLFQISPLARTAKNLVVPAGKTRIGDIVIDATLNEVINYNSIILAFRVLILPVKLLSFFSSILNPNLTKSSRAIILINSTIHLFGNIVFHIQQIIDFN